MLLHLLEVSPSHAWSWEKVSGKHFRKMLWRTWYGGRLHAIKPNQVTQVHTGKEGSLEIPIRNGVSIVGAIVWQASYNVRVHRRVVRVSTATDVLLLLKVEQFCIKERLFLSSSREDHLYQNIKNVDLSQAPQTLITGQWFRSWINNVCQNSSIQILCVSLSGQL